MLPVGICFAAPEKVSCLEYSGVERVPASEALCVCVCVILAHPKAASWYIYRCMLYCEL